MQRSSHRSTLSRRSVLKGTAGAAGLALGAGAFRGRSARAQASGTVRLTGWSASPQERPLLEQTLEGFRTKFPNITLEYEPIPSNYLEVLQTQLAAGQVADVFYVDAQYLADLASRNVLLPLNDRIAGTEVAEDQFYPALIQAFRWQDQIFGLPKDWSSIATVYNRGAYDQAGLATAPTNWDELRQQAQQLVDAGVPTPVILSPAFDKFFPFLVQAGGSVTNPEVTEITIGSDATLQALQYYNGLYADGLGATFQELGGQSPDNAFAQGQGAIMLEGNWVYVPLRETAPDIQLGIAEPPAGPAGKGTAAFTVSYSIFQGSENPDAAWEVVRYLTGPEGMGAWTSGGFAMPARPDLATQWTEAFPERAPYLAAGDYARVVQFGPGGQQFRLAADEVIQNMLAGQLSPEDAVAQLQTAAESSIQLAS